MKYINWLRVVIITLILYLLSVAIYLKFYYSPVKTIEIPVGQGESSSYSTLIEANQLLKNENRDEVITFLVVSLFISFSISILISLLIEEIVFSLIPVSEAQASLISKETSMKISGDYRGFSAVGYNYVLVFEIDSGEKMKFPVNVKQYAIVCEGNKGVLKYKNGKLNRFVGFEIKSIS